MTQRTHGASPVDAAERRLLGIFRSADSKRAAHSASRAPMGELAADPAFLRAVLAEHLRRRGSLNAGHYPVLSFPIASNPYFDLVANAWIPLPDRRTDLSTKSIHHHGELLLTTATAFGPGYEHWMLALPRTVDPDNDVHPMELIEHGRHALHEVAFVDSYTAHVPLYPAELTITYCLWSARQPKTWRDSLKRIPLVQRHSATLRRAVTRLGLASRLEVKNVEYFDFYPTDQGFVAMRERDEFPLGPNANYLRSLMHVIQATGNADLAPLIRAALQRGEVDDAPLAEELLARLEAGTPIDGVLSDGHVGVEHANFTREAIERALQAQRTATAAN